MKAKLKALFIFTSQRKDDPGVSVTAYPYLNTHSHTGERERGIRSSIVDAITEFIEEK